MGIFYSEIHDDFRHILNSKGVCNIPDSYLVFMSRKMLLFFYHKKTEEITFQSMDKWLTAFTSYTRKYRNQIRASEPIPEFDPDKTYVNTITAKQKETRRKESVVQKRKLIAEGNLIITTITPKLKYLLYDVYTSEQHNFLSAEEASFFAGTQAAAFYRSLREKKLLNKKYLIKKLNK